MLNVISESYSDYLMSFLGNVSAVTRLALRVSFTATFVESKPGNAFPPFSAPAAPLPPHKSQATVASRRVPDC